MVYKPGPQSCVVDCEELVGLQNKVDSLQNLVDGIQIEAADSRKIAEILESLRQLDTGGNFVYNEKCRRFELKMDVLFQTNKHEIPSQYLSGLKAAGRELQSFVANARQYENVKFVIVIDGRAAKRHGVSVYSPSFLSEMRRLSYNRALSLYNLWKSSNIIFDNKYAELIVSGSGFEGSCRYIGSEEDKNKRFVIQIIPYIVK